MDFAYDDQWFWDQLFVTWDGSVAGNPRKPMVRIRKNIRKLPQTQLMVRLRAVHDGLSGNSNFTTPAPSLASYDTKLVAVETKLTAISDAEAALRALREERDVLFDEAVLMYAQLASYVENIAGNDRAKAESSNFEVVDETNSPAPPLIKVTNVTAEAGPDAGQLAGHWAPDPAADAYELQSSPDPITPTSWTHAATVSITQVMLADLPSLAKRWIRVRSVHGVEHGPWSDPACAVVS